VRFWTRAITIHPGSSRAAALGREGTGARRERATVALLSMGLANCYIVDWDAKFTTTPGARSPLSATGDMDGNDAIRARRRLASLACRADASGISVAEQHQYRRRGVGVLDPCSGAGPRASRSPTPPIRACNGGSPSVAANGRRAALGRASGPASTSAISVEVSERPWPAGSPMTWSGTT